jgi:hypothetical protein
VPSDTKDRGEIDLEGTALTPLIVLNEVADTSIDPCCLCGPLLEDLNLLG